MTDSLNPIHIMSFWAVIGNASPIQSINRYEIINVGSSRTNDQIVGWDGGDQRNKQIN